MRQITNIHCSKLSRPMTCAGSLFFEDLPEKDVHPAALEGTACGEYLEHLLIGTENIPLAAKNGVRFDDEMKFHAGCIAEEILSKAQSKVLCETPIDWQTRSGIWIKGKYDASYVHNGKLYIDDLKYGWNIVEVKENWQLLGYAIGEVIRRGEAYPNIVLRIHQPRPHHEDGSTREWEITYEQLLDYKEKIEARMDQISRGFRELVTGKNCKYCPAAENAACTAFSRASFHALDYVMSDFIQDSIDEKQIAYQLDVFERAAELVKLKYDSLKELAINQIKSGKLIPGWTTESSLGDRKWKKDVSPLVIETLTGKKIVEEVMLSPAKAEKIGVPRDLVNTLVDRELKGMKLTRDSGTLGNKIFGATAPEWKGQNV